MTQGGGSRTMDLVLNVSPYQDIANFALNKPGTNDTVDGYMSTTASTCNARMAG